MIRIFGGDREMGPQPSTGEPSPESNPPQQNQTENLDIELHYPTQEEHQEPQIELHHVQIVVPENLAQEILPTIQYIFQSDKAVQQEYGEFLARRLNDEIAKLLDPDRAKTEGEERRLDEEIQKKINSGEARNPREAKQILLREHLYAPESVQRYWRLMRGLAQREPIDLAFLEKKLHNRRIHEDGVAKGEAPHWKSPQPPTKKERKRAEAERDKMDRFLAALGELRRRQQDQQ